MDLVPFAVLLVVIPVFVVVAFVLATDFLSLFNDVWEVVLLTLDGVLGASFVVSFFFSYFFYGYFFCAVVVGVVALGFGFFGWLGFIDI